MPNRLKDKIDELTETVRILRLEREQLNEESRKPRCGTCRYWNTIEPNSKPPLGDCRRNAPRPKIQNREDPRVPCFPMMFDHEWCGEWDPTGWHVAPGAYRSRENSDPGFA